MDPSIDNHSPTADSSFSNSCDKPGTPESDAKTNNNMMSSAFDTPPPSPSPSTSNLPMTQITNNGGTININYNFHTAPFPRLHNDKAPAVAKGAGTVYVERDPDLPAPLSSKVQFTNAEPSPAKFLSEGHVTPEETVAKYTGYPPHKKSHQISAISDDEKAEVKHSIDLMLLGSIGRKGLSDALMDLAQALVLIDDDEGQYANVPIQLGTGPSSADPDMASSTGLISPDSVPENIDKIDHATEERVSIQEPVNSTPISPTNECPQHDCSGLSINAPPACRRVSSSQRDVDEDGDIKSGATSSETMVFWMNDPSPSSSVSIQDTSSEIAESQTGRSSSKRQGETEDITSPDFSCHSPRISQETKLVPEPDDVPARTVVTPAASPKKSKKKTRRALVRRDTRGEARSKEAPKNETILLDQGDSVLDCRSQNPSPHPQEFTLRGVDEPVNQNEVARKLEPKEGSLVAGSLMSQFSVAGPSQSSSWKPARLTLRDAAAATTTTTEAVSARPITTGQQPPGSSRLLFIAKTEPPTGEVSPSKNSDMGQKLEKRRGKKPAAIEASQSEKHAADGPSSSSVSDAAARRAMVVDMLSRMAGGPASGAEGAQGSSGHRDFSFLLPPPAETRKCRLCRNMFTDKSNVKQADGGAPCSFHPGVLEDKTGNNTIYAFSCCGGPPIMVGPNLVAMNLVSPGCTKCYHQDKRSAWNLETFTMKDPVLFEE